MRLRVVGSWPGPLALASGWFRARARPWNDTVPDPMVRLDRGGADFLDAVTSYLTSLGSRQIFSPALHPGTTRQWRAARFETYALLDVMEMSLSQDVDRPDMPVVEAEPKWSDVVIIDRAAFRGFWGMSQIGLQEAYSTNTHSVLLMTRDRSGYAILGTQWGVTYLHRIGVHPDQAGSGVGTALMRAGMIWGRARGGQTMLLNVRPENTRAHRLYERLGFTDTGAQLQVLCHRVA